MAKTEKRFKWLIVLSVIGVVIYLIWKSKAKIEEKYEEKLYEYGEEGRVKWHTSFPDTPAVLTFRGETTNLVTTVDGDLYYLYVLDGTYSWKIYMLEKEYSGIITIVNGHGYAVVS